MNPRRSSLIAFSLGLAAVLWVAANYLTSHPVALCVTLTIAAVYLAGAREMQRFQQQTDALAQALNSIPDDLGHLGDWLQQVPDALRQSVRRRIEGESVALPAPALTPYLVGLLVLLGMLGTFLGMVVTLNGAVLALESTTDLNTIRSALAAPVKGLGVAFGTSVAGVATSAMLGLISSLCRRERQQIGLLLDGRIGSALRVFSRAHQRQEMVRALQAQSALLPTLVDRLDAMLARIGDQHQQLADTLQSEQQRFHASASESYARLAREVSESLQQSLRAGAQAAADAIQPLAASTLNELGRSAEAVQQTLATLGSAQIAALEQQAAASHLQLQTQWSTALAAQRQLNDEQQTRTQSAVDRLNSLFSERTDTLLAALAQRQNEHLATADARESARLSEQHDAFSALAERLEQRWQNQEQRSRDAQAELHQQLAQLSQNQLAASQRLTEQTLSEVSRLMQTAGEAPRIAAEVIGELRESLSASMARDNSLLDERARIMDTLSALLATIQAAAGEQRQAIDALLAGAARTLEQTAGQLGERIGSESARLAETGTHLAAGGVELASLGDAFAAAVDRFGESGDKMMTALQRIEAALSKSLNRSDEQLAYYVAQAREVIDLSILSQQKLVDELQHTVAGKARHPDLLA